MAAAARALEAGKPIVAIKTGATAKSQAAAQSHTGAIGGDYAAYLAMCERYGIYNCRNLDDMMEAALAFDGGRLPKGPRIGFVTTSGGTVDLLYDYAEFEGAPMPDYAPETLKGLMPYMQEGIEPKNPLDLGIPGGLKQAAGVCEVVAKDPNIDMIAWAAMLPSQGRRLGRRRDAAGDGARHRQADRRLRTHELPDDAGSGRSADAGGLSVPARTGADHPRAQRAVVPCRSAPARSRRRRPLPRRAIFRRRRSTPRSRNTASRCRKAARSRPRRKRLRQRRAIGFPVVLKIRSADILHKTEAGGVVARLAQQRRRAQGRRRARRLGPRRLSERADRRLPGAGDGVRHRGDRRRAQRPSTARCCWSAPAASWSNSPRTPRCGCCR